MTQLRLPGHMSNASGPSPLPGSKLPVLKWAGGKRQLLPLLIQKVPLRFGNYIEPFFGGGALFFWLEPERALISDSNPELVNFYQVLASHPEALMTTASRLRTDEATFYEVRESRFEDLAPIEAAARTLFLNKTCFNGLYRVNRKGHFNVPYGRYKNPKIFESQTLMRASQALRRATLVLGDFRDVLAKFAMPGDFVYLDPPYVPVSKFADFKRYTKEQFHEADHRELAEWACKLRDSGCHVLLSNSDTPLIRDLYRDFHIEVVEAKRNINNVGTGRTGTEVLIWSS